MKQVPIKLLLCVAASLQLLVTESCTFRNEGIISAPNGSAIKIYYPVTNSEIQQGSTPVEYLIDAAYQLKFIELYINGNFIKNFPPNTNGTQPTIIIDLDTSYIGKSISYFLISYYQDETSIKSEEMTNIKVFESQSLPAVPYDIKLLNLSEDIVNISWKDSSMRVDSFQVWRKVNFNGIYSKIISVAAPAFNINDDSLLPDSIYFYKIKAINVYGESEFSEEVNTENLFFSNDFYPPSDLLAEAIGSKAIKLTWKDNSAEETYFLIERKTDYSDFIFINALPENSTSYKDSSGDLIQGVFYTYRIKSYSPTDSAWSNESRVQTFLYDIPAPQNLTADYNSSLNLIVLTWLDTDTNNSIFEIERKEESASQFVKIAAVSGVVNFFSDTEISTGNVYDYRVRSGDGTVYSAYSNIAVVNTGP